MAPGFRIGLEGGQSIFSGSLSQNPESMLRRAPSSRPISRSTRRHATTTSRSSTAASSQRRNTRRTPSGTPAPIQSRTIHQSIENSENIDDDDSLDHIILALDKTSRNTIGCAYYVARDGVLYCMEDITSAEGGVLEICEYAPITLYTGSLPF